MRKSLLIAARIGTNGPALRFVGREAWALQQLYRAGERGVTPITHPAPRWSGYVRELRLAGVQIETIREPHGGQFPGSHGRYVLRSQVEILEPANDA